MKPAITASIKHRMILCLLVLAGISVVQVSVASFLQYSLYRNGEDQRMMTQVATQQMLGDMKHDGIQGDEFRLIDAVNSQNAGKQKESLEDLSSDIATLDKSYGFVFSRQYSGDLQQRVNETVEPEHDYTVKARAVAARVTGHPEDYHADLAAFTASFDRFEQVQENLSKAIKAEMDRKHDVANTITMISVITTLLTIVAGTAALGWAGLFVWRSIIEPTEHLSSTLLRMANGDYDLTIVGDENGDEIERMAAAARVFRDTALAKEAAEHEQKLIVSELSAGLERLANKDLEGRINSEFPAAYAELKQNFNQAVASLAETISATRIGSIGVLNGVTEIRSASDDLALRNEEQAQSVDVVNREAAKGGAVVARAVEAMAALEASSAEIAKITDVIDGISFQTNLLALNAGVEAARAGDAGKGFAVVATEVRALAQRSAEAASNIKGLIDRSSGEVQASVQLVRDTGGLLERIVSHIGDLNATIQQNAAMAEETTAATRTVSHEAEKLSNLVETFRTRDANRRPMHTPIANQMRRKSVDEIAMTPARSRAIAKGGIAAAATDSGDWAEF